MTAIRPERDSAHPGDGARPAPGPRPPAGQSPAGQPPYAQPYDGGPLYDDTGQIAAVVEQLADPLNDPLPGRRRRPDPGQPERPRPEAYAPEPPRQERAPGPYAPGAFGPPVFGPQAVPGQGPSAPGAFGPPEPFDRAPFDQVPFDREPLPPDPGRPEGSPWFRPGTEPGPRPRQHARPQAPRPQAPQPSQHPESEPRPPAPGSGSHRRPPDAAQPPGAPLADAPAALFRPGPAPTAPPSAASSSPRVPPAAFPPAAPEPAPPAAPGAFRDTARTGAPRTAPPDFADADGTLVQPAVQEADPSEADVDADGAAPPAEGRAARRRAAQEHARRPTRSRSHGTHGKRARRPVTAAAGAAAGGAAGVAAGTAASGAAGAATRAPGSRLEARRAARAAKDSPFVVITRVFGELFITFGVLMLLFVGYQLWWTNVIAHKQANSTANALQEKWNDSADKGDDKRSPGAFEPGEGFAILYIPKLDVKAPVAEGVDKHKVLDKGLVGHYSGTLETAMPWDEEGNFALAGHRNTHGEPFRYINQLKPGDPIVVETENTYYVYEMASLLPQTPPSNIGVIGPVPPGSGFTEPGRYITLTTCTPEFTSKYRMIVWGKLVEERPRSKGKPDALVE